MEASASRANTSYQDEELSTLAKLITIFEGNGHPFGITRGQDVSAKRLRPALKEELLGVGAESKAGGRISVDNVPRDIAMQALLEDKKASLVANQKDASPGAVAEAWNTEKHLKERTGKSYSEWISSTYRNIVDQFANEQIRKLLKPITSQDLKPSLTPTLDLLQKK